MKKAKNEVRLLMMKGGVVKEIDVKSLPKHMVLALEEAYDQKKVVGISRETYSEMVESMALYLKEYREELEETNIEMFRQAVAFANGFYINSRDSKLLFETFCWIDRNLAEHGEKFTSRDVNTRAIREYLSGQHGRCSYADLNRDFKGWAHDFFISKGMKRIGFVKMAKFYYSVVTNEEIQPIPAV